MICSFFRTYSNFCTVSFCLSVSFNLYLSSILSLRTLDLAFNEVSDVGLLHLTSTLSRSLKNLFLAYCTLITDQGVSYLPKLECLEILMLSGCVKITDAGWIDLCKMSSLRRLCCCQRISQSSLEELKRSLPETEIVV